MIYILFKFFVDFPFSSVFPPSRLVFPAVVTLVIATLTFPPGFGQFMAGEVRVQTLSLYLRVVLTARANKKTAVSS